MRNERAATIRTMVGVLCRMAEAHRDVHVRFVLDGLRALLKEAALARRRRLMEFPSVCAEEE